MIAARIRRRDREERRDEIVYHVGRPGHELIYNQRMLHSWGIDGHNSHTNICSAGARTGYAFWNGIDRPSPDSCQRALHPAAELASRSRPLLQSARATDYRRQVARREVCVIDTRLSNTASKADYWLSTWPGTEAAVLLAMCNVILHEELYDREFVRRWVNWEEYLREEHPQTAPTFENFIATLKEVYAQYTPEFATRDRG